MKAKFESLILGIALIGAASAPALAGGDYYTGSAKDYAGVPVPAPIPVPLYDPVWYFRIDAGVGMANAPDANESGHLFGEGFAGNSAVEPFGTPDSWTTTDFEQYFAWGIGVGYRWNNWFRADITGDTLREQKVNIKGSESTQAALILGGVAAAGDTLDGFMEDHATLRGGVVLINGYYDFNAYGAFRPYVGAGLGVAITEIARRNDTVESTTVLGSPSVTHFSESNVSREQVATIAASVTLGTTYRISDITDLDFNYRYLYVNGPESTIKINGRDSNLEIEDTHDHQLRAGLRFNVN